MDGDRLFDNIQLIDVQQRLIRNIVSIRSSQDLFDDLSDAAVDWALAQRTEDAVKPPSYASHTPVIDRPFEDAEWFNSVMWPFKHWQASRYSDGTFGAWYGSSQAETTVYETVYHWYSVLLHDAGFEREKVVGERKLYDVSCGALLWDLRSMFLSDARLRHATDYSFPQSLGARLHREGHPGLLTHSVRYKGGENFVIMNPDVLSGPTLHCQLTYRLDGHRIVIEKQTGVTWMEISTEAL